MRGRIEVKKEEEQPRSLGEGRGGASLPRFQPTLFRSTLTLFLVRSSGDRFHGHDARNIARVTSEDISGDLCAVSPFAVAC